MRSPKLSDLLAAKDTRKRGEAHHSAKLTRKGVATIRQALARGVAPATIVRECARVGVSVTPQAIYAIRDRKTWK